MLYLFLVLVNIGTVLGVILMARKINKRNNMECVRALEDILKVKPESLEE